MFTADDIRARMKQQPFVPVRFVTSSGQSFDVYHPDLVMVGRRDLMIGTASAQDPSTYEQVARVARMHVTALEDLPTKASGTGNGQQ
jgi:hypothetical protein